MFFSPLSDDSAFFVVTLPSTHLPKSPWSGKDPGESHMIGAEVTHFLTFHWLVLSHASKTNLQEGREM